ncbi:hypothetical protein [Bradyrhizobium sp.]|uniref:hypothetical protein n=1 Tax=Bradyrhizobium sp. TaxID=376 RepID=UPI0025B9D9AF|nr:hypothetical protein [Bradyrhizobium sp.]
MKYCTMLVALLSIVSGTASQAMAAPDTVYIDGLPCNIPCQAYMAWSRRVQHELTRQPGTAPARRGAVSRERVVGRASPSNVKRSQQARVNGRSQPSQVTSAKGSTPTRAEVPQSMQPPLPSHEQHEANDSSQSTANGPQAPDGAARGPSNAAITRSDRDAHAEIPSAQTVEDVPADKVRSQPTGDAIAAVASTTVQHQAMAAAAVAEQLTALGAEELRSMHGEHSENAMRPDDRSGAAPVEDTLVALVVTRPDIKSVQELTGKDIAIDKRYSDAEADVRTAMVAAGASDVRLSGTEALAVDRLVQGQVPAAVLTLVSPDAAKAFPQLAGFSVLQVPLSPTRHGRERGGG